MRQLYSGETMKWNGEMPRNRSQFQLFIRLGIAVFLVGASRHSEGLEVSCSFWKELVLRPDPLGTGTDCPLPHPLSCDLKGPRPPFPPFRIQ